jgi:hypothetical protein
MDTLSRDDLKTLMEETGQPCVSLFLPMERAGKETRQNAIRFKNALRDIDERLQSQWSIADTRALLQPLYDLADDSKFWQYQSDGLALFRSQSALYSYRLPLNLQELLVVSDRFHVKPVLAMFTGNVPFYILALSQNCVRLFQGTRYSVDEVTLPDDMPRSIDAMQGEQPESQLQVRTVPTVSGGQQTPMYHGQGAGKDEHRTQLLRYFQEVDKGLRQVLQNQSVPMVLAGVEYLHPLYRERNSYPYLLEQGMTGNPDDLKPHELHAQAWEIVYPQFLHDKQQASERYHYLQETERASSDLRTVLPAAVYGRVEALFVAIGVQLWGSFDAAENRVEIHQEQQTGDSDLLDLAAAHTILKNGTVYALEREKIPGNGALAAVFRY